ncbi:HAD family phosphatase [Cellulomonas sp. PhB150]|uniref:HAD family hydrolase n=1 Tax=Cellulomonas sp. PhB150 TaxID=2485188 RepID=UPI000F922DE4|nr:HAD family phosphatase [Cellulomonas sp. PhB150]ROS30663.1 2-haloacid dehalogenase [Cellulomonas sp. PhB150]
MTDRPVIDTVVFDLGDVLVRWDPRGPFVARLAQEAVDAFLHEFDFRTFNLQQDAGRSWADARLELEQVAPEHVPAMDLFVQHFADSLVGPVPGTAEIVEDLAAAGVRLLGLSNWSAETFHLAEPAAPAIGLLEGVVVSGHEKLSKPDPRIYALLVERYGLDPARTLFTDDSPPNIAAAAAAGLDAVHFTSADDLRERLVARGVAIPRHVTVDGERFAVRPHGSGLALTWLSGPDPTYGFAIGSNDGSPIPEDVLAASIRSFLADIDPATGYLE